LQHLLLDFALLKAQHFLARSLLFLPTLLLLGFGEEPGAHLILGALPLRRSGQLAEPMG